MGEQGKGIVAKKEPAVIECEAGTYYWCSCGHSSRQPFCDGSHRETSDLRSMKLELREKQSVAFCQCKQTSTPPFCDGSHSRL